MYSARASDAGTNLKRGWGRTVVKPHTFSSNRRSVRMSAVKFGGGGEKCTLCTGTVFPAERLRTTTDQVYHQSCFRCTKCKRPLQMSTYAEDAGTKRLYCTPHYKQLAAAAGLDAVARGGIDSSAGVLVEAKKKEEFKEEVEQIVVGSPVWLSLDDIEPSAAKALPVDLSAEPFVEADVTSLSKEQATIKLLILGKTVDVPRRVVSMADKGGVKVDNLQLLQLTEPNLISNLKDRFKRSLIYTWTGEHELLAINPYQSVDKLYTIGDTEFDESLPHVYAVAERAYRGAAGGAPQAVVVSGESGAGKTETNKHMIIYLRQRASVAPSTHPTGGEHVSHASFQLGDRVLEAFGNAATVINDNSSRFGKYLELQLTSSGKLNGGRFKCFLLEKSRVVRQADAERNFHIFYILTSGAPSQLASYLKLKKSGEHSITPVSRAGLSPKLPTQPTRIPILLTTGACPAGSGRAVEVSRCGPASGRGDSRSAALHSGCGAAPR